MSLETVDKEYIGQVLLSKGFRTWFLYMFRMVEGTPFILEPLHDDLLQVFDDIYNQYTKRINLNLPPRSAKSSLCCYFVAFCLAKNPKCNFIYTSYSQLLLGDVSRRITAILEHPVYKAMYPVGFTAEEEQSQPISDFWLEYLRKETGKNTYTQKKIVTYAGGVVYFSAIGSQITGLGCFDYDTLVHTDKGIIEIGDIVENKKEVKILSYDFTAKKRIYKPIDRYIKNEKSHFIKIILNNGEIINCTPDHLFYLQNGQSIIANGLKIGDKLFSEFSNPFYLAKMKIKHFCDIFSSVIFIKHKENFTKRISFNNIIDFTSLASLVSKTICYFTPNQTAFNIGNRRRRNIIIFSNFLICSFIFSYIYCLTSSKFLEFSILEKLIISIGLSCTIFQVFKRIISWIRIFVSDFKVRRTFTDKSKQNKRVNSTRLSFAVIAYNIYSFVTFFYGILFKNLVRFFAKNFSRFTDVISSKIRDIVVVDIVKCNYIASSYCVSVRDTNNLFIGKSQQLIHNCGIRGAKGFTGAVCVDDGNKPADVYSQRMRDNVLRYFEETLLSRLNNSDAAIINVQQRLHVEDLSGHLKAKYGFDELVKPLLVNDVCQLPKQYTPERIAELKRNQYMFSAQYQQHPIILGGQVFHRDWWRFYAILPEFEYCFMTADTAMKIKQANDYSVFCLWGVTRETNDLYLIDMIRGKWEAPDLERQFLNFWAKWQGGVNHTRVRAVYIEDKASGTGLIQSIKRKGNIPIRPIMPEKDKLQRAYDATPFIEGGRVYLPQNENFAISKQMIDECEAFTTDDSQIHDDVTDNLTYAVDIAYRKQPMRINPDVLL